MSARLDFLATRDERAAAASAAARISVAEALDPADVVMLRVTCQRDQANGRRWTVVGYTHRHVEVRYDRDEQAELFAWLRDRHPGVDWHVAHQADLRPGGGIHAAPLAEDDGYLPEEDHSFGEPRPPVYSTAATSPLPFPATESRRAA